MNPRRSLPVLLLLAGGVSAGDSIAQEVVPPPPAPVMIINGQPVRDARELATTPEARAALRNRIRMSMPARHPDVARVVGLEPAEVSRLFDMLADRELIRPEMRISPIQEVAGMPERARAALEQQVAEDADVATLLGSRYEAWLRYRQSQQTRVQVENLRRALLATGQPIADVIVDSLVEALDVEMRFDRLKGAIAQAEVLAMRTPASPEAVVEGIADRAATRNRLLLDAAARWLTPEQLAVFSRQLDSQSALAAAVGSPRMPVQSSPTNARDMMSVRYPDVARVVGLTAGQVEKLFDLLAIHQADGQSAIFYEQQRSRDAELESLLGSQYGRWQQYQQTLFARSQLQQLRMSLSALGMPLDDATLDKLVEVIYQAMRPVPGAALPSSSGSVSMGENLRVVAERNGRLLDAAAPLLDPRQYAEYARIINLQVTQ